MSQDLESIAAELVADGKGVLAADESIATLTRRFDKLGIPSTEESRRGYREMLFTTRGAAEFISGAILYDETIRQKSSDGTPLAEVLPRQGIVPGIKVDTGAEPLAGFPDETVTEGLDKLRDRLAEYHGMGARFAKWRAVIRIAPALPSQACVSANAHALARYAALCQERQLVPIVEPEVLMNGDHTDRALRGGHRQSSPRRVRCPRRTACLARVHAAQAQHGHRRHGVCSPCFRARGRERDAALPAPARARGGARHRLPVGRPDRSDGHGASERD